MPPKRKTSPQASSKSVAPAKQPKVSAKASTPPPAKVQTSAKATSNAGGDFSLSGLLMESGWKGALEKEMEKEYFKTLEATLAKDYASTDFQTFPSQNLVFNSFNLTPLSKVKAVILGQDPYHDVGQAHGLAFSVPESITKIPPSLKNMYKELEDDIGDFKTPSHGCLEKWAQQGVLLLNATLTVRAHQPNSHKNYGWQPFTDEVIRTVSNHCDKVVFLLWGNFAHKKEKLIDTQRHVVLKDAHPSPLSFGKFHHCKCFSRANTELVKAGLKPVDWGL